MLYRSLKKPCITEEWADLSVVACAAIMEGGDLPPTDTSSGQQHTTVAPAAGEEAAADDKKKSLQQRKRYDIPKTASCHVCGEFYTQISNKNSEFFNPIF